MTNKSGNCYSQQCECVCVHVCVIIVFNDELMAQLGRYMCSILILFLCTYACQAETTRHFSVPESHKGHIKTGKCALQNGT